MRAKQNATVATLFRFEQEILAMQHHPEWFFNNGKIREFFKNNGVRLDSMRTQMKEITEKYFVMEKGHVKMEGEGDGKKEVLKEGMTREDFDKERMALLEKETVIDI